MASVYRNTSPAPAWSLVSNHWLNQGVLITWHNGQYCWMSLNDLIPKGFSVALPVYYSL